MADAVVHLRPPGQTWQILGHDYYPGVMPADIDVQADPWGFATCRFEVPRDPFLPHPDLSAYTPCIIEQGSAELFRGKVIETPARGEPDLAIAVEGRGLQYALDENPVHHAWCHNDMTEWKDIRSIPGYPATQFSAGGLVEVGSGGIILGRAQGETWVTNTAQGVYLDLGPDRRATRIEVEIDQRNLLNNGTFICYARGRIDADPTSFFANGLGIGQDTAEPDASLEAMWSDAFLVHGNPNVSGASQIGFEDTTVAGYFNPPARTIALFLHWTGGGGALGADYQWIIKAVRVYGDSQFGGRWAPSLRASDIIGDAVKRASVGITIPEQSPLPFARYEDELYAASYVEQAAGVIDHDSSFYRLRSPIRTEAEWLSADMKAGAGGAVNLSSSSRLPTYFDTGGPLRDGDPGGSAFARLDGSLSGGAQWLALSYFPTQLRANMGFAVFLWFRTSTLGNAMTGGDPTTLNNRLIGADVATTPTNYVSWLVGIDNNGKIVVGSKADDGSFSSMSIGKTGFANLSWADGQWHLLAVTRQRMAAQLNITVDERTVPFSYANPWSVVANTHTSPPTPLRTQETNFVYFGSRAAADKVFNGDLAEIAVFFGERPLELNKHLYRAARRNIDTNFYRTLTGIPGAHTTEPRAARTVVEGYNAYHRFVTKIGKRAELEFRPLPTVPKYALTADAARRFHPAALTAGEQSYNRCVTTGQDGAGRPITVERIAAQQPGAIWEKPDSVAITNPSFESAVPGLPYPGDANSWSYLGDTTSTPVRDGFLQMETNTTFVKAGLQSLLIDAPNWTDSRGGVYYNFKGNGSVFRRGRLYRIQWWMRPPTSPALSSNALRAWLGDWTTGEGADAVRVSTGTRTWGSAGTWEQYRVEFIPSRDMDNVWLMIWAPDSRRFAGGGSAVVPKSFHVDHFEVFIGVNGLLDRQNDLRTHTIVHNQALSTELGTSMSDAFLQSRVRQQLRGSIEVGPGDIVTYSGGEDVHPSFLVADTMQMLHIPSLIDPDTGALGRDGMIVSVGYNPESETAQLSIDNQADNFEVLAQRHALLSGG